MTESLRSNNDHSSFSDICFSVLIFKVRHGCGSQTKKSQHLRTLFFKHLAPGGCAGSPISSRPFPTQECNRAAPVAGRAQFGCPRPAQNVCRCGCWWGLASPAAGALDLPPWWALPPVGSPLTWQRCRLPRRGRRRQYRSPVRAVCRVLRCRPQHQRGLEEDRMRGGEGGDGMCDSDRAVSDA